MRDEIRSRSPSPGGDAPGSPKVEVHVDLNEAERLRRLQVYILITGSETLNTPSRHLSLSPDIQVISAPIISPLLSSVDRRVMSPMAIGPRASTGDRRKRRDNEATLTLTLTLTLIGRKHRDNEASTRKSRALEMDRAATSLDKSRALEMGRASLDGHHHPHEMLERDRLNFELNSLVQARASKSFITQQVEVDHSTNHTSNDVSKAVEVSEAIVSQGMSGEKTATDLGQSKGALISTQPTLGATRTLISPPQNEELIPEVNSILTLT